MRELLPARLIALGLALFVVYAHIVVPAQRGDLDDPLLATGHALVALPFLFLFAWTAGAPERADRTFRRRFRLKLDDPSQLAGAVLHVVFLYLVFGLTVLSTAQGLSRLLDTGQHPADGAAFDPNVIVTGLMINLVLFAAASISWVVLVNKRTGGELWRELGLEGDKAPAGVLWGLGATLVIFVALFVVGYLFQLFNGSPDNPQADAIVAALDPTTAVLVAALAGIGEELYFRGFLLPKVGNVVQAALFGAIHMTYLTAWQVILPAVLGYAFGVLRNKTSLWAAITAHTAFNAVMLLTAIYADELAVTGLGGFAGLARLAGL